MTNDLIIIGASGHGKVVADIARQVTVDGRRKYETIRFLDDDSAKTMCGAYPVIGSAKDIEHYLCADFFVAIGNSDIRRRIAMQLEKLHADVPVLVHPKAIIGEDVSVGKGTAVVGGAVINTGTVIGAYCIINTGATVDHDCVIGDYVHVAPGAHLCGGVHVGEGTWIGAGATVVQELEICAKCMIGAGSVVVRQISKMGTYAGVPAKRQET